MRTTEHRGRAPDIRAVVAELDHTFDIASIQVLHCHGQSRESDSAPCQQSRYP
jgi:hypothetical protein